MLFISLVQYDTSEVIAIEIEYAPLQLQFRQLHVLL